jgi:hypothetical protein
MTTPAADFPNSLLLETSVVGGEEHIRRKKLGVYPNLALGLGVMMLIVFITLMLMVSNALATFKLCIVI